MRKKPGSRGRLKAGSPGQHRGVKSECNVLRHMYEEIRSQAAGTFESKVQNIVPPASSDRKMSKHFCNPHTPNTKTSTIMSTSSSASGVFYEGTCLQKADDNDNLKLAFYQLEAYTRHTKPNHTVDAVAVQAVFAPAQLCATKIA